MVKKLYPAFLFPFSIYANNTFSRQVKQFRDGRERLENEPNSGRRISKTPKQAEMKTKEFLKTDVS